MDATERKFKSPDAVTYRNCYRMYAVHLRGTPSPEQLDDILASPMAGEQANAVSGAIELMVVSKALIEQSLTNLGAYLNPAIPARQ